jgi:hypothetical protein
MGNQRQNGYWKPIKTNEAKKNGETGKDRVKYKK